MAIMSPKSGFAYQSLSITNKMIGWGNVNESQDDNQVFSSNIKVNEVQVL